MKRTLPSLIKALEKHQSTGKPLKAIVGFDAYIDSIQKIVNNNEDSQNHYFETISDLATQLAALSGKNTKVNLRQLEMMMNGNAPILANSLGALGVKNTCIATMGYPDINGVFEEMHPNCELVSIASPAKTTILEFNDGKIIFSEESTFEQLTWSYVAAVAGVENLSRGIYESSLLAFVNWANVKYCTDIWKGFLEDIVVNLSPEATRQSPKYFSRNKIQEEEDAFGMRHKNFFFDLSDISKRTKEEILEILDVVGCYAHYGKVSLAMNESEAKYIYGLKQDNPDAQLPDILKNIISTYHIQQIFVHAHEEALMIYKNHVYEVKGKSSFQKRISTGGRDNFNAGACLGLMLDLLPEQILALAVGNYEAYLGTGASLELSELIDYLKDWEKERHHEIVA